MTRATKCEAELAIIYQNGSEKKFRADELQGFIFGGFSSRFWLMQNFINMQEKNSLTTSMFCWNMISLSLKSKKEFINLIVPKEKDMDMLIQFLLELIYETNAKKRIDEQVCRLKLKNKSE